MAKKEIKIEDVITKIKAGFRKDVYIVDNMYCIPGETTSEDLITSMVLIFNPDVINILKVLFPDTKYIHITDIANAKNDLLNHIVKINKDDIKYCDKIIKHIIPRYDNITIWKNFNFSDEDCNEFKDGKDINLSDKDSKLENISFGKNVLPFISPTKLNEIAYHVDDNGELVNLYTSYVMDYFQVYNLISFLNF